MLEHSSPSGITKLPGGHHFVAGDQPQRRQLAWYLFLRFVTGKSSAQSQQDNRAEPAIVIHR
jgi:hypothetical protein